MPATPPTLIYDDHCMFCTWAAQLIQRYSSVHVVLIGSHATVPELYNLTREDLDTAVWVQIGEANFSGADALAALLREQAQPARRALGWLMVSPGVRSVCRRLYGLVAANRGRVSRLVPKSWLDKPLED